MSASGCEISQHSATEIWGEHTVPTSPEFYDRSDQTELPDQRAACQRDRVGRGRMNGAIPGVAHNGGPLCATFNKWHRQDSVGIARGWLDQSSESTSSDRIGIVTADNSGKTSDPWTTPVVELKRAGIIPRESSNVPSATTASTGTGITRVDGPMVVDVFGDFFIVTCEIGWSIIRSRRHIGNTAISPQPIPFSCESTSLSCYQWDLSCQIAGRRQTPSWPMAHCIGFPVR